MNLSEVYQLIKQENPDKKIGKSKFSSLRPGHVQLSSQMPRNVCICRHHRNMILILEALPHKLDEIFPVYSELIKLWYAVISDFCWNNSCENCKDALLFKSLYCLNYLDDKNVEWYQWEKVPGPNGKEYLEKVLKKGTALELYDAACTIWPSFLLHYFIKQKQANAYEDHKSQVQNDSELAVLQIDFAENFSTLWQDEVQCVSSLEQKADHCFHISYMATRLVYLRSYHI